MNSAANLISPAFFKPDNTFVGAKGLVFIGNKVAVYRRDTNTTLFPLHLDVIGGGKEDTETPFETFKREVKEEISLDISEADIIYARFYPKETQGGSDGWFVAAQLPASIEEQIVLGNEGIEFFVMSPKEFATRTDVWPKVQQRSIECLESLKRL